MCVTFTFVLTENKARVIVTFSPSALFNHSVLFYEGVFKSEEKKKKVEESQGFNLSAR